MSDTSRSGYVLLILMGLLILPGCVTQPGPDSSSGVTVEGTVKPAGMTSFMYGTHLLYDESGRLTHALTSDDVNLSQYEGQRVTITGESVEGYPVDNGPPYLRVTSIQQTTK